MKGYLVTNHFLTGKKFDEINEYLIRSARALGITLVKKTNSELLCELPCIFEECIGFFKSEQISFVLFWDKDIRLAQLIERCGVRVFNSSSAIECCDDKSLMYIRLSGKDIPMPQTVLSPKMFFAPESIPEDFIISLEEQLLYPIVVKECYGSFGKQVYLAENREELTKIILSCSPSPLVFQEFIKTSIGRDFRLNVVGDRVVASMMRYSDSDFRANISNGGHMLPHTPTKEQEELAIKACCALGLDFAGVDLLIGKDGAPILCEVNSNAHFVNIYNCTGVNVADHIMKHIKNEVEK